MEIPFIIRDLEQGSIDWHQYRQTGLGASEAPSIMGISPWKTAYQLWEEKTGKADHSRGNAATNRGQELEPQARTCFELTQEIPMKPISVEMLAYPYIRASLDGYNVGLNQFLEIKCPGKKAHDQALAGEIPEYYVPQLMQQFLVTGAQKGYYFSFDGEKGVTIEVFRDDKYIAKLLKELVKFWDLVQTGIPPEPTEKDYQLIEDKALHDYCSDWKALKSEYDRITTLLDECEGKIKNEVKVNRGICNGVKLTRSTRRGNVEYAKIPALEGLDLEPFRKPNIDVFKISLNTDKKNRWNKII